MFTYKNVLVITLCLLSSSVISSEKKVNGWTIKIQKVAVNSCTKAAVNSNMRYLVANGHIPKNTSKNERKRITDKITVLQSAVCKCAQNKMMNDYHFKDMNEKTINANYRKKLMASCNAKIQKLHSKK